MIHEGDATEAASPPEVAGVLAVDLGATRLRAAAVSAAGAVLVRHQMSTPHDGSPQALSGAIVDLISAVAADLPADTRAKLGGIGVSAVGPLDAARGILLGPPNLGPGYRDLELATPLRRHFGVPVAVERDTNVAALGERAFGAARGRRDFIYLTVSSGIGGGVVTEGRLLGGRGGFAGELGHVPVAIDGAACGCGQPGHLEAYSSGIGIARRAQEAVAGGHSKMLAARARKRGGHLDAVDVVTAEADGDPVAEKIVAEAIGAFAVAVVGFVNTFAPELIVVGGGVMAGLGDRLLGAAQERIASLALAPPTRSTNVVAAQLGEDVGLIGCLPLVAERTRANLDRQVKPSERMEA
ncbi:MAG: ROK family protein [Actinobacteria bacterium]|nr:ROK family protein [Actinomycetota bacterium]